MIVSVFGDSTRQGWLGFLPRQCRVTTVFSRQPGELVSPPACALAVLAAVMRKEPGTREEMQIWDLREDDEGRIIAGSRLTDEELDQLKQARAASAYLLSIRRGRVRPDVIVIDPAEEWYHTMVLSYGHDDPQYAISLRERRIAETLYYLQREARVVLVSNERPRVSRYGAGTDYEPDLPPAIHRQCDLLIHVERGVGRLVFQREHVGLPVAPGEEVTQEHVLDVFGFLSEPVDERQ